MKKSTQFVVASSMTIVGAILLSIPRFTASADTFLQTGVGLTVITIVGLILMIAAALWFYIVSFK